MTMHQIAPPAYTTTTSLSISKITRKVVNNTAPTITIRGWDYYGYKFTANDIHRPAVAGILESFNLRLTAKFYHSMLLYRRHLIQTAHAFDKLDQKLRHPKFSEMLQMHVVSLLIAAANIAELQAKVDSEFEGFGDVEDTCVGGWEDALEVIIAALRHSFGGAMALSYSSRSNRARRTIWMYFPGILGEYHDAKFTKNIREAISIADDFEFASNSCGLSVETLTKKPELTWHVWKHSLFTRWFRRKLKKYPMPNTYYLKFSVNRYYPGTVANLRMQFEELGMEDRFGSEGVLDNSFEGHKSVGYLPAVPRTLTHTEVGHEDV